MAVVPPPLDVVVWCSDGVLRKAAGGGGGGGVGGVLLTADIEEYTLAAGAGARRRL